MWETSRIFSLCNSLIVGGSAADLGDKEAEAVGTEPGKIRPEEVGNSRESLLTQTESVIHETQDEIQDDSDAQTDCVERKRNEGQLAKIWAIARRETSGNSESLKSVTKRTE